MSSSETLERRFQLYRLLYHILRWNMFCTLIMLYTGPIDSCCKWTRSESGDPWMKSFLVPGVRLVHMKGIRTISTAKTKVPQTTVSKGNKMLRNATHTQIYIDVRWWISAMMNKMMKKQWSNTLLSSSDPYQLRFYLTYIYIVKNMCVYIYNYIKS